MVIAIHNTKGGVAKTTTTISIASKLAQMGYKILAIDLDSQCNLTEILLPNYQDLPENSTIYDTLINKQPLKIYKSVLHENLHVVPSNIILAGLDKQLSVATGYREARLREQLDKVKDKYDFCLIDCPPNLGWGVTIAYVACDRILIPVAPGRFEVSALDHLEAHFQGIQQEFNKKLDILGVVQTLADSTIMSNDTYQYLKNRYQDKFIKTSIPKNTQIAKAHARGLDIFSYDSLPENIKKEPSKVNVAYEQLVKELLTRI